MKTRSLKNSCISGLSALASFALLGSVVVPATAGQGNVGNPGIAPPQSSFRSLTYSEWSEKLWQWLYSLPSSHHPLNDNAPCGAGQTGKVWFIDGTAGAPFPTDGRDCTIPPGTALFLMLKGSEMDNDACDSSGINIQKTTYTEAQLRYDIAPPAGTGVVDGAQYNLLKNYGFRKIIIDGVEVKGLPSAADCDPVNNPNYLETCTSPYRVQTPVFDFTVPADDNLLAGIYGACYEDPNKNGTPYTVTGAVGDGFYVMINPLSVGKHEIQFGPLGPDGKPTRTYHITVGTGAVKKGFN